MAMTQVPIDWKNRFHFFKACVRAKFQGISPQNMAKNMVQYLHFRILKIPLIILWVWSTCPWGDRKTIYCWWGFLAVDIPSPPVKSHWVSSDLQGPGTGWMQAHVACCSLSLYCITNYMGVSINGGAPMNSHFCLGLSFINHPAIGVPPF